MTGIPALIGGDPASVSARLRSALIEAASSDRHPGRMLPARERPCFILGPGSILGRLYAGLVTGKLSRPVAFVDDYSREDMQFGLPRWTTERFVREASQYRDAIAIDFSVNAFTRSLFEKLCGVAGIELRDMVAVLGELNLHAVYESVPVMRDATLAGLDRFLALESRFADDLSRATLYAMLLLRLTWDRRWLDPVLAGPSDEYFSVSADGATFHLSEDEIFCDAGAHTGTIVSKFLAATRWRYRAIHAYEPDPASFAALKGMGKLPIHDFEPRCNALSSRRESLGFMETGTQGSHVSEEAATRCEAVALDDEIERLSFLKMDIEGYEARALRGAARLLRECRPRMAITAYHHPGDLPDIVETLDTLQPGYHLRLRQHYNYYYDTLIYASPAPGWLPPASGQ